MAGGDAPGCEKTIMLVFFSCQSRLITPFMKRQANQTYSLIAQHLPLRNPRVHTHRHSSQMKSSSTRVINLNHSKKEREREHRSYLE
jgi:hypothetical protein